MKATDYRLKPSDIDEMTFEQIGLYYQDRELDGIEITSAADYADIDTKLKAFRKEQRGEENGL